MRHLLRGESDADRPRARDRHGADDVRINEHLDELVRAMVEFKKDFEMRIYPGAAHAFFNDTRGTTYREAAAKDAWDRVVRFYRRMLGA